MKNAEIARILYAIAEFLDLEGVAFKPRAYEKAARSVESLPTELSEMYAGGGLASLEEIPGVGAHIAAKIEELLKTGSLAYYEDLKKRIPVDVEGLMGVPGLGPKRIMLLYQKLGVKDVAGLEEAAKEHRIRAIRGLGPGVEANILKGVEIVEGSKGRFLYGEIEPLAEGIRSRLGKLRSVGHVEIAGSYRRRKETVGDLDILVTSTDPQEVMRSFTTMKEVGSVVSKGTTRSTVRLSAGINVDLRVVAESEFGSALQYFTGSKDHGVATRRIANSKGLTLSEYGLFRIKGRKRVAGESEEGIYSALKMQYIEPEMRENTGEVEAALKMSLPDLVRQEDVRGDLQTQTDWSDGMDSLEGMVEAAARLGYEFIAITDHGGSFLKVAHALDEKRLERQSEEIDRLSKKHPIRILKGAEVDILKDGTLALSRKAVESLDFVLAAVHGSFKMPEAQMTKRIVSALETYPINALAHPTGRVINKREPYAVHMDELFRAAKATGTFLEIDGFPERLDLKDAHIKAAKAAGCRFTLSTDAHARSHLAYMKYAVFQARRGWLEAKDVLNTYGVKKLEKELAKRR